MATAAVVWRDAVTDIFKDALGHSRVHRAESLLDNLQRGGYGTLDAMRRADEADLVACGCPEDVASVVLSELNAPSGYYGGDDDDGECPCVCARMYCFGMARHGLGFGAAAALRRTSHVFSQQQSHDRRA